MLSNESRGLLLSGVSGLLYGLIGFLGVNVMNTGMPIPSMLFWRFGFAGIITLFIIKRSGYKLDFFSKSAIISIINGGVFYGGASYLCFLAGEYMGIGLAMVLFFMFPVVVACYNFLFLKQKMNKFHYFSFLFCILGIILLVDYRNITFDIFGMTIAVLSAIFYGIYMIITTKQTGEIDSLGMIFYISFGNIIVFGTVGVLTDDLVFRMDKIAVINLVVISSLCTVLPIYLLNKSLEYIDSIKASIISVLQPVLGAIMAVYFLGERITNLQIGGIVLIIMSSLVVQMDKNKVAVN